MKTGIFGYKGRVHYHCGTPINQWLSELDGLPRNEYFQQLSKRIDQEIHSGYRLYPCNYIALPNKDEAFLRERMLTMYANPVRNYINASLVNNE